MLPEKERLVFIMYFDSTPITTDNLILSLPFLRVIAFYA